MGAAQGGCNFHITHQPRSMNHFKTVSFKLADKGNNYFIRSDRERFSYKIILSVPSGIQTTVIHIDNTKQTTSC